MEMYNPIRLLKEAFDAHGLKYLFFEKEQIQSIHVPFGINNGPFVDVRYISLNRGNDISVRIMNLANKVPQEKRIKVLEAINILNNKYRFLKFNMDPENNIHVEYDLPVNTGDDSLGEMAFEVFIRTMQILNDGYILIAQALYSNDVDPLLAANSDSEGKDLFKLLKDSHDEINIKISKAASTENREN